MAYKLMKMRIRILENGIMMYFKEKAYIFLKMERDMKDSFKMD